MLAIAEARTRLKKLKPTSTVADIEALLGPPSEVVTVRDPVLHVFACDGGEVHVGSWKSGTKLKYVRVFERPAGLPAAAKLSWDGDAYVVTTQKGKRTTRQSYALDGTPTTSTVTDGDDLVESSADPLEPILMAITDRKRAVVAKLLPAASPTAKTDDGRTILHALAEHFPEVAFAQDLIARGADIAARDDSGQTPLDVATRAGRAKPDFLALLSAPPRRSSSRRRGRS